MKESLFKAISFYILGTGYLWLSLGESHSHETCFDQAVASIPPPYQGTCSCLLCVTAHANLERNPSLTPWKRSESESCSVVSDSLRPQGLYSPWNSPSHNTLVGSFSLLQGIFPTQGLNSGLPHCGQILYQLSHKGSPSFIPYLTHSALGDPNKAAISQSLKSQHRLHL